MKASELQPETGTLFKDPEGGEKNFVRLISFKAATGSALVENVASRFQYAVPLSQLEPASAAELSLQVQKDVRDEALTRMEDAICEAFDDYETGETRNDLALDVVSQVLKYVRGLKANVPS